MSKPSDAGAWLKTHPRLRVKLAALSIDEYVVINKIWLYCQDAGNCGRLHVDELPAAVDRLLAPGRLNKALAGLMRPEIEHRDGTVEKLWLDLVEDHVVLPPWWRKENPGPEVWNDDVLRWRYLRNKELNSAKLGWLRDQIKQRDRSLCRYCGRRVKWGANNSELGGTYDHVDPDEDNTLDNVVIACRRDNGRKADRTPEQWIDDDPSEGLSLLPSGTTAADATAVRARAGPKSNLGRTQAQPKSNPARASRASPPRVEPKSNPSPTRTGSDHSRPDTDHPGSDRQAGGLQQP